MQQAEAKLTKTTIDTKAMPAMRKTIMTAKKSSNKNKEKQYKLSKTK